MFDYLVHLVLKVLPDALIIQKGLRLFAVLDQAGHVSTHLLDLADQATEVLLDSVQEVGERSLDLFHFLLNADDTLLELLANVSSTRVILALGNHNLLCLDVAHLLGLQLNVVVS